MTKRTWIRVLAGAALAVGSIVALSPAPAGATSATTLLHTQLQVTSTVTQYSIVRLPAMTLTAGSKMYLHSQMNVTAGSFGSTSDKILEASQIWCYTTGSTIKSQSTTTNRYPDSPTGSVQQRWIFDVPVTASWTCQLVGWVDSTGNFLSDYVNVLSGASNTYLYINDTPDNGLSWMDTTTPDPVVASGSSTYIDRQTWPAVAPATAPASTVSVMAEAEVTLNYAQATAATDHASVTATLYVNQINGTTICAAHSATPVTMNIDSKIHHYKFYLNYLAVPVTVSASCPKQWAIKVLIQNAGPTSVTVNTLSGGGPFSAGLAVWGSAP